jgi:hypothetical protein
MQYNVDEKNNPKVDGSGSLIFAATIVVLASIGLVKTFEWLFIENTPKQNPPFGLGGLVDGFDEDDLIRTILKERMHDQ